MRFAPIAIVGRSCVLPGALTPAELGDAVVAGRDLVTSAPPGRWGVDASDVLGGTPASSRDRTWSDRGGYVDGFERVFDPAGFGLPAGDVAALDPLFQWLLHGARTAAEEAGGAAPRTGGVFGNLSFPSAATNRYAEELWRTGRARTHPANRFSSGLPALLVESALGLTAGAFALDAACASSLYAVKLACDALQDGRADMMLAGAVNCTDDLFIHVGFAALQALSLTGQSRPFHAQADGLVPAEGAAILALVRLEDAVRDGRTIHGVVRGVGLSNDGRGRGMLVPSEEGQARAVRQAYELAGLGPLDVALLECHATGTQVGDATEIRSLAAVRGEARVDAAPIPLGSLKSNMGHLITAAGAAAIVKMTEAMARGVMPPTLHVEEPTPALEGTPFRLLAAPEPWSGPRRAGISAFGFGGNNAHVVLEAHEPSGSSVAVSAPPAALAEVSIVGIGVAAGGGGADRALFTATLLPEMEAPRELEGPDPEGRLATVELPATDLRFPPNDLRQALPQQLLVLRAALEASAESGELPRERTGVFVGMGVDAEIARYGLRFRLPRIAADEAAGSGGGRVPWLDAWIPGARDRIVAPLEAAGVLGTMPNIPANRLNRQLDLGGPSFTISEEEHSGLRALRIAARAIATGEIDAAVVGAVDLSCEPVHRAAAAALLPADRQVPGDAAVVMVLRRLDDAEAAGLRIYATVAADVDVAGVARGTAGDGDAVRLGLAPQHLSLVPRFGHAHAASGLLHAAAAALALHHRARPDGSPWLASHPRRASVTATPMTGAPREAVWLHGRGSAPRIAEAPPPRLLCFSGESRAEVRARLEAGESDDPRAMRGPCRLVIVTAGEESRVAGTSRARRLLETGRGTGVGIHYREGAVRGDLALVFTAAGAAYPGMGRALLRHFPEAAERLSTSSDDSPARFATLPSALGWAFRPEPEPDATQMLWGASALCQVHAELALHELGLTPAAVIGYSSGESNALAALGIWRDVDALRRDFDGSGLFAEQIGGRFAAVAKAWGVPEVDWAVWNLLAPVPQVLDAIAGEPRVHLSIVHAPEDCIVAGDAAACERVAAAVGRDHARRLPYNLAVHVPELAEVGDLWRQVHRRPVSASSLPGVRVYGNATNAAYAPTSDACADAILGQAVRMLDFPRTVEQAWADGVRVFVEMGPQSACGGYIAQILGARRSEAAIASFDRRGRGIHALHDAVAELLAAGVAIDDRFFEREHAVAARPRSGPMLAFPAHPAPLRMPAVPLAPPSTLDPFYRDVPRRTPEADVAHLMTPPPGWTEPTFEPQPESQPVPRLLPEPSPMPVPALALVSEAAALSSPRHEIVRIHEEFLRRQGELHQRFLELRRHAAAALSGKLGELPVAMPAARTPHLAAPPVAPVAAPRPEPAAVTPTARSTALPPAPPTIVPPAPARPAPPAAPAAASSPLPKGPTFDRDGLLVHASGRISEIFGPAFAGQDGFRRQVRMPEPPLLLADRVTGIDAVPGSMGKGTIWTESDVAPGAWYLNDGYMSPGLMIESGQADLMLISYLGVDALNRGERVYRLLGCELTYHADLPRPGETLAYDIHVDDHAAQGDVRLMFFHYDCHVNGQRRLSVRGGQAGFFTDEELAGSAGILWRPEDAKPRPAPRLDPPAVAEVGRRFDEAQVRAFSEARPWDCFGEAFSRTKAHVRTPRIQPGKLLLLERITDLDPSGGPWKRGYLRGEAELSPSDWFFSGHFKNDPCMPGTLMFEACFQAMAFYLAALGYTIRRDGWRFQPTIGDPFLLRCRGQATPASRNLVYEVFVEEVVASPVPTLYADLLCTVDGLKAFHAKRVGLQLVPDWPVTSLVDGREPGRAMPASLAGDPRVQGRGGTEVAKLRSTRGAVARHGGAEKRFDYASLVACAWGRPTEAFGPMYARFDGPRTVARLPGPPYHFMSAVTRIDGAMGELASGATIEVEYDVPPDAWYYGENGAATMPFCVLLEAALQPCGWLASFRGSTLDASEDLSFRNLDGTGTLHGELLRDAGTLRTVVTITNVSRTANLIIESFDVACFLGERRVYDMKTVFGFFPAAAFENQAGLPTTDEERAVLSRPSAFEAEMAAPHADPRAPRLAGPMLLMLDRVTGWWPDGGSRGLGEARAEKRVDAAEWFFKCHFFTDPVQPGSLGIEAMLQLLQWVMREKGLHAGIPDARFEPIALGLPLTWKYRGQVLPENGVVAVTLAITEVREEEGARVAVAESSFWVDGKRIYHATNLGMRVVPGLPPDRAARAEAPPPASDVEVLDPAKDVWLADHRPTWNRPALPMMSMVDRIAAAVPGPIASLQSVRVHRWFDLASPRQLRAVCEGGGERVKVRLLTPGPGQTEDVVAEAIVVKGTSGEPPAPLPPLEGAAAPSPYDRGELFHGPAFHVLRRLVRGRTGASSILDAGAAAVPVGRLHPALLDGALHGIPHDHLELWCPDVPEDHVGFPSLVTELRIFGPTPTSGDVRCEVRTDGSLGSPSYPAFRIQLVCGAPERVWIEMRLVEACFPKGPLGSIDPLRRRAFLRDRRHVEGVRLSRTVRGATRLSQEEVDRTDWMPGTVEGIYGTRDVERIAVKEHLAARERLHPGILPEALPLDLPRHRVEYDGDDGDVVVMDRPRPAGAPRLDLERVAAYWSPILRTPHRWLGEELFLSLLHAFVGRVVAMDPPALDAIHGRSALFVGNHQVQIESLLVTNLIPVLTGNVVVTMANAKHERGWIGALLRLLFSYPGCQDPANIVYFDPADPASMLRIMGALEPELAAGRRSFFVHTQGTRAQSCREEVTRISSLFLDLALKLRLPVVPVRFTGGLPVAPIEGKLEFPAGYGRQDYWLGRPILPDELGALPYRERAVTVLDAMNALGPSHADELPAPADADLEAAVQARRERTGAGEVDAVLAELLARLPDPGPEARQLREIATGRSPVLDGPRERWLESVAHRLFPQTR